MNLEKFLQSQVIHGALVGFFTSAQWLGKHLGPYLAKKRPVKISKNIQISSWDQSPISLDLYVPQGSKPTTGWPVALMIHGGGWRFFSKDSHALVAARIAEQGYLTLALNYRLAPQHPYPAGLIDVLSVYDWIHQQAQELDINLDQIAVAGESAGASFALAVAMLASGLATLTDLDDPRVSDPRLAQKVAQWRVPKKAVIHCGFFHVSDTDRYQGKTHPVVHYRMKMIKRNYLPQSLQDPERTHWGLADPVVILETRAKTQPEATRRFPEVFIPVGDRDPVLADSERLGRALEALGISSQVKIYPQAPHSFYAMPWHAQYERCWSDIRGFLGGGGGI